MAQKVAFFAPLRIQPLEHLEAQPTRTDLPLAAIRPAAGAATGSRACAVAGEGSATVVAGSVWKGRVPDTL
jgi:hypothetical protein